jgi:hypothetical protein
MGFDIPANRCLEFAHAGKDSTVQSPTFQLTKPAFNGVQPGGTGGREVKFKARMFLQPGFNFRCFVRPTVVQNQMKISWEIEKSVTLIIHMKIRH